MPHETLLDNQGWFKKLARRFGPGHVVNTCFLIVMLFSTLLTWREVMILKDAYVASQRNHLGSVANVLDRQLQFNMDRLIFYATVCMKHWWRRWLFRIAKRGDAV